MLLAKETFVHQHGCSSSDTAALLQTSESLCAPDHICSSQGWLSSQENVLLLPVDPAMFVIVKYM